MSSPAHISLPVIINCGNYRSNFKRLTAERACRHASGAYWI